MSDGWADAALEALVGAPWPDDDSDKHHFCVALESLFRARGDDLKALRDFTLLAQASEQIQDYWSEVYTLSDAFNLK